MQKVVGWLLIAALAPVISAWAAVGGGDVAFEAKAAGKVMFSHDSHVGAAGLKCTVCHDALYVTKEKHKKATMKQMQQGRSCGSCHDGKQAFDVKGDCSRCHKK